MPVEQNNPNEIGVVTGVSGEAYAQTASGTRTLEPGSPIYQGEELVTGGNGNVEVRFVDDTLISQGANSRIALDDYVYDPDGGESSFLGDIAEGTFRTVTGKIAEQNPDRFKLGSPLATIGIRGTIILSEVTGDGEKHGVEQLHAGKAMLLQSKATGQVQQLRTGQMLDISKTGLFNPIRPITMQELTSFRDLAPSNIRQEQEIQKQREEEEQQNDPNDEQKNEQQDEQQDGTKDELPGDVDPGGGTPGEDTGEEGGALHANKGVFENEEKGLSDQKRFEPDKLGKKPEPNDKPEIKDEEKRSKDQGEEEKGKGEEPENSQDKGEIQDENEKQVPVTSEEETGDEEQNESENDTDDSDDSGSETNEHDKHGSGLIKGTAANETITGSSSQDTIYGEGGNDTLYGEAGDDELFGGTGNDSMFGGAGEDMLNGGAGNNYLDGGSGEAHETDFASFDGLEHGVNVDLSNKNDAGEVIVITDDDDNTQDVLVNIEGVIGTAHKDTLTGDDGVNRFAPGLNEEYESSGAESVEGGDGKDWIQFETLDSKFYVNMDLSDGLAEIHDSTKSSDSSRVNEINISSIENIIGSSGNDKLRGDESVNNTILGGKGNDLIDGKGASNILKGEDGNDSIIGGSGDDNIDGGSGDDSIKAGKGTNVINGGSGIDSLTYSNSDTSVTIDMNGNGSGVANSADTYISDTFSEVEKIKGSTHDDTFNGSAYADTFDGNDGADVIKGLDGADVLSGGEGNDTIYGGAGNDIINGGLGQNNLYGGTAAGTDMGLDTLSYAGASQVTIDMQLGKAFHDSTYDHFYDFDTFIGSDGEDIFTGHGTAVDIFFGGKGNDTFTGKDGNDTFDGGTGTDTISFIGLTGATGVVVNACSTGYGTATHLNSSNATTETDKFTNVESFVGTDYVDTFNGCSNNETFLGGKGADVFDGGGGHDTLDYSDFEAGVTITVNADGDGQAERTVETVFERDTFTDIDEFFGSMAGDTFIGGTGDIDQTFCGNSGTDSMDGGGGTDFISFESPSISTGVTIDLADNADGITCTASGGSDDSFTNIEGVIGSSYSDTITASSVGASTIQGGGGADTINLVNGKATELAYTSLSEGGDTINDFKSGEDYFYFGDSDLDSSAEFYTFSGSYDGEADKGTDDAYFIFDDNNKLWYDSNGDQVGGQTMIAQIASGDDVNSDDISFA
ncbi:FecR domain-containing protein [Maridesulfovibrio salexigens]|uniref:Hemolysin-type calcium-binding region n=1 Tax=Maridesulfovibrio salexigens (strain ATCC 14822 / DSM 2638 / NCIMB 8403 / VKM B-1763) TaxID=526222 RepID=C6BS50_MARSD|nr:FecR domain-containing protein [Maridesulfovibrio salexigens]ACS81433.1 Hemolysin-type calcium-binding region [Maridesulfovibrio salexigens DSM 2638]